jgi:hypothetical protein
MRNALLGNDIANLAPSNPPIKKPKQMPAAKKSPTSTILSKQHHRLSGAEILQHLSHERGALNLVAYETKDPVERPPTG